jgi:hypothetical protein
MMPMDQLMPMQRSAVGQSGRQPMFRGERYEDDHIPYEGSENKPHLFLEDGTQLRKRLFEFEFDQKRLL